MLFEFEVVFIYVLNKIISQSFASLYDHRLYQNFYRSRRFKRARKGSETVKGLELELQMNMGWKGRGGRWATIRRQECVLLHTQSRIHTRVHTIWFAILTLASIHAYYDSSHCDNIMIVISASNHHIHIL